MNFNSKGKTFIMVQLHPATKYPTAAAHFPDPGRLVQNWKNVKPMEWDKHSLITEIN